MLSSLCFTFLALLEHNLFHPSEVEPNFRTISNKWFIHLKCIPTDLNSSQFCFLKLKFKRLVNCNKDMVQNTVLHANNLPLLYWSDISNITKVKECNGFKTSKETKIITRLIVPLTDFCKRKSICCPLVRRHDKHIFITIKSSSFTTK